MFDPWLKYFKSKLVTKTGGISKNKAELPTGNRMWEIAARSNARPMEVRIKTLDGKTIILRGTKMTDSYKVVKDGKVIFSGTETECDHFADFNAQHGEVVPAN